MAGVRYLRDRYIVFRDRAPAPKPEHAVRFEAGKVADHSIVKKKREIPLDRFLYLRVRFVNERTQVGEDWLCESFRLRNVGIDSWIPFFPCRIRLCLFG